MTVPEGMRCSLIAEGFVDAVAFYVHEEFFRMQLPWLPASHPVVHQSIAAQSEGYAMAAINVGDAGMRRLQPLLSSLVSLGESSGTAFAIFARTADLFDAVSALDDRATEPEPDGTTYRAMLPRTPVAAAAGVLRARLDHPWTVGELAREVAISESQLSRLFRRELGLSPASFLWQARLDHMAELLVRSRLTVSEAARRAGWINPSAAARAFKRRYGVSPSLFAVQARGATPARWPATASSTVREEDEQATHG
ncbi:AraC family transcriptional regulator [Microbacterium foliorum]